LSNTENIQTRLNNYYILSDKYLKNIEEDQISRSGSLNKLFNNLNSALVLIQNEIQNLTTLKLLLTNQKIDSFIAGNKSLNIESAKYLDAIEHHKCALQQTETSIKNLIKLNLGIQDKLGNYHKKTIANLGIQLKNIDAGLNILSGIIDDSKDKLPDLNKAIENNSDSIAKIITNLQYHDIIRQKIEHIQHTQNDLIKGLVDLESKNGLNKERLFQLYIQIKDIAGLQAAQLLYANKEYQVAIEEISNKFSILGEENTRILFMCRLIAGTTEREGATYLHELKKKLGTFMEYSPEDDPEKINLDETLKEFYSKTIDISVKLNKTAEQVSSFINLFITSSNNHKETNTASKIVKLCKETDGVNNRLKEKLVEFNKDSPKISSFKFENTDRWTILGNEIKNIIREVEEKNLNVVELIEKNEKFADEIKLEIKNALEKIKYYDFFQKTAEQIIDELNNINIKMQDNFSGHKKEENLERLKKKYTMASEHEIHEKIVAEKNHGTIEDGPDEDISARDDDNLELF
jgi:hypothetical protein